MSADKPLVSIVVPTYKRSDRIRVALDSIAAQDYGAENIELIVVSDNRPEWPESAETDAAVAPYAASLPHFRLLHTSGQTGGGAARNYACRQATGEYLTFLDDDDEFLPDKVSTQVAFMQENSLDMSWQDVSWYDERGRLVEHRRLDHCEDFSTEGLLRAHLLTPISPTAIYMLRRDLFDRTEGVGEVAPGQDWWLMLRCIEAGAHMGYMPEVHVRQYLHSGERLSLGKNKVNGEVARHEVVRGYYPRLSKKDVRYIEFRHNAVLAFAMKRSNQPGQAVIYALKAIASSPAACVSEALKFFGKAKS